MFDILHFKFDISVDFIKVGLIDLELINGISGIK